MTGSERETIRERERERERRRKEERRGREKEREGGKLLGFTSCQPSRVIPGRERERERVS